MAFLTGWPGWSLSFVFWRLDVAFTASPASILEDSEKEENTERFGLTQPTRMRVWPGERSW